MKLPSWIGSFQEEERDKKENLFLYSNFNVVSSINKESRSFTHDYDEFTLYIRESELDSLKLGKSIGNVKFYSDNIGNTPMKRL